MIRRVALMLLLAASACEGPTDPIPAERLQIAVRLAAGSASAASSYASVVEQVNRVALGIRRPDGSRRDTVLAVERRDGRIYTRILLDPREGVGGTELDAQLLIGTAPVFGGRSTVGLDLEGTARATFTMSPIPARVVTALPDVLTFDAVGRVIALSAAAVFATGDTILELTPTWISSDSEVVEVVGGVALVKRNGNAHLVALVSPALATDVEVRVRQIARSATILPTAVTLTPGGTAQFQASAVDAAGFPLTEPPVWETGNAGIVAVDQSGLARALSAGQVDVRANFGGLRAPARVTVIGPPVEDTVPEPPPLFPAELAWTIGDRGVVIGDLTGAFTELGTGPALSPTWSPDHQRIAYIQPTSAGGIDGRLMVTDRNGNAIALPTGAGMGASTPEFSANGAWIYFTRRPEGQVGPLSVYRIRPTGNGLQEVETTANAWMPTTSPDGRRIVYIREAEPFWESDLMIQDLGGTARVLVENAALSSPSWSPDGQWIAAMVDRRVTLVRPDGSGRRDLGEPFAFSWSPDARWMFGTDLNSRATLLEVSTGRRWRLPWSGSQQGTAWWR